MKLTFQDMKRQYLRNIGQPGSTNANILADFTSNLGQRYQLVLSKMANFKTQIQKTATTVADQQYYAYPNAIVNIESATVTVGGMRYPLTIVNSQKKWDNQNFVTQNAGAYPQLLFPRRDDFGIWPIPNDAYTITLNIHIRDRNLSVDDVEGSAGVLTNASATFTDAGALFTEAMVGRWMQVTSTDKAGQGQWYRIASYNSTTSLTLENTWQDSTISGAMWRIGQCPEIPDEGHIILVDGATADFYKGERNAAGDWATWNNSFWTGDPQNASRDEKNPNIKSGLIGLVKAYADRNRETITYRRSGAVSPNAVLWSTTISDS